VTNKKANSDPYAPLTETELQQLDEYLLNRIDDDAQTDGKDEGILDVSELDGLFTAIVSGPSFITPSQWLPVIWGDFEPEWRDEREFKQIFTLLGRHLNGIADTLMEQPEYFEPMFLERTVEGKTYTIVEEWCRGYMRGVSLALEQWDQGGELISALLMPILVHTSKRGWETLENMSETEKENIQQAITPNVREIHAHWLTQRAPGSTPSTTIRHTTPTIGRNDPCPCGSGKKYKKCCLQ